jgi:hypothetical protein
VSSVFGNAAFIVVNRVFSDPEPLFGRKRTRRDTFGKESSKMEDKRMRTKKKGQKKPDPFQVTWDMVVWVPLYALLLLAIFAGISALMIWALDKVALLQPVWEGKSNALFAMGRQVPSAVGHA